MDSFSSYLDKNRIDLENTFYPELDSDTKKIFLIGSSHVGRLNQTYIQEHLSNNDKDYEVYNLAYPAETPRKRLLYLDSVIAAKPDLIVYGVGYRDFIQEPIQSDSILLGITLPNPNKDFKYGVRSIGYFLNYDFDNFRSPQLIFRYLVRDIFDSNDKQDTASVYTKTKPFYPYDKTETIILNDTQLQKTEGSYIFDKTFLPFYDHNPDAYALSQILEKLKKNDIKVIIFSTPHVKFYSDNMPPDPKNAFDNILKRFSEHVSVYLLRDKYIDLPVWSDAQHIAINTKSLIYSSDIAEIILNEVEP